MPENTVGTVLSLALRPAKRALMQEVGQVHATPDVGLTGDVPTAPDRGITLIAKAQWEAVIDELGVDLPWHTRRANVLVDAPSLGYLIGSTIRVGDIEVDVKAETKPCDLMEEIQPGLRDALAPDCRGGVYGRIVQGGTVKVGDTVTMA